MKRDEILSTLTKRTDLKTHINKLLQDKYLAEEMFQELFVILCEMPNEKIEQIYQLGYLDYYIISIINNQCKSTSSPFYRKIKEPIVNKQDHIDANGEDVLEVIQYNQQKNNEGDSLHALLDSYDEAVDSLYFYDKEVLALYLELGTIRKVAKHTNINHTYISASIGKSKREIKKHINKTPKKK